MMFLSAAKSRSYAYRLSLATVAAAILPLSAAADVVPHALISNGMVQQQQQREVNIWGTADPGERVVVRFREQEKATTADDDGRWRVQIESKAAGGPFTLTIAGRNEITLRDVYVGEVWVCSGQSNMQWPVASRVGAAELAGTADPRIRLFTVPPLQSDEPQRDFDAHWQACGPTTLVGFSAVAYYFGRQIATTQRVPVGLIHASYGGSGVQSWMSARSLTEAPELAEVRRKQAEAEQKAAVDRERLRPQIERYETALAQAKKEGTPLPQPPRGMLPTTSRRSRLYNGMIAPLIPFSMRGVIWYQGEANVSQSGDYRDLFSTLIRGWREDWGQGDFPFLFVQIAPFGKIVAEPQESDRARIREAQLQTSLRVPHTGMAVVTDWGHETDIHVKQKRPVGERLALLARAQVYGEKIVSSGPTFRSLSVKGNRAILSWERIADGLQSKRMVLEGFLIDSREGKGGALHVAADAESAAAVPLQGFTVAGADRKFFPAVAEIQGETVIVSSPEVSAPVAVRYGWADYPTGNLFNSPGLPASPFRTDDWPPANEATRPARSDRRD